MRNAHFLFAKWRQVAKPPQTVDQSNNFRQFDESFDQRAQHVSLSSKRFRLSKNGTGNKKCIKSIATFSLQEGGAEKEVKASRCSAANLLLCTYILKEKADERFCAIYI